MVARSVDVYRNRLEREGVKLTLEIADHLPPTLLDENAMTLVLLNLLDNAVKYGVKEKSKGEISVRLIEDAGALKLSVKDEGPGIDRDERRKIFDRFYRARAARHKNTRGSGIGLSLVKHIADAHGGRVTVESEPSHGATFIVTIPVRHEDAAAPEEEEV